jgi:hypothetical protein
MDRTLTIQEDPMYSPKIKEEYISVLYHLAKSRGVRMTHFVNQIIFEALEEVNLDQIGTLPVGEETSPPPKVNRRSRRNGNPPRGVPYQP